MSGCGNGSIEYGFWSVLRWGRRIPNVVERVRAVVRAKPLVGRCTLVMDATGVGAPVLDLLRLAHHLLHVAG